MLVRMFRTGGSKEGGVFEPCLSLMLEWDGPTLAMPLPIHGIQR